MFALTLHLQDSRLEYYLGDYISSRRCSNIVFMHTATDIRKIEGKGKKLYCRRLPLKIWCSHLDFQHSTCPLNIVNFSLRPQVAAHIQQLKNKLFLHKKQHGRLPSTLQFLFFYSVLHFQFLYKRIRYLLTQLFISCIDVITVRVSC